MRIILAPGGLLMDSETLREEIRSKAELSFSRSGGPGGQNVNKRDSKVTIHLAVDELEVPGEAGIAKIKQQLAARINSEGFLVIQVDGERSQLRNREEAFRLLETLLLQALRPDPKPRKKTKPSRAAKERRIRSKKKRSSLKNSRGRVSSGSDE